MVVGYDGIKAIAIRYCEPLQLSVGTFILKYTLRNILVSKQATFPLIV
jgi:hypothetical protein